MKQQNNSKKLKKWVLIISAFAVATGGLLQLGSLDFQTTSAPVRVEAYSPPDERFTVQFPTDPEEKVEAIAVSDRTLQYQEYKSEADDTEYKVSYIDFPGIWKMAGSKTILTKSFHTLLDHEEQVEKVIQAELTHHQGNPSLHYHLIQAGKEVKGRLVIVGNTIYQLVVSYPKAIAQKIDTDRFLNSFRAIG